MSAAAAASEPDAAESPFLSPPFGRLPSGKLSTYQLGYIIGRWREAEVTGISVVQSTLASFVGCTPQAVSKVLQRFREGRLADAESSSDDEVPVSDVDRALVLLAQAHPDATPARLLALAAGSIPADMLPKSAPAVLARLRKYMRYATVIARPPLRVPVIHQRLAWCKDILDRWLPDIDHFLWLDEATVARTGNRYRWITNAQMEYGAIRLGIAQSWMVCCVYSFHHGLIGFHVWRRGTMVTWIRFRDDILEGLVRPFLARVTGQAERQRLRLVLDGAGPHNGTAAWCAGMNLALHDWVSCSPDLSAAEMPWAPLKTLVNSFSMDLPMGMEQILRQSMLSLMTDKHIKSYKAKWMENVARCIERDGDNKGPTS